MNKIKLRIDKFLVKLLAGLIFGISCIFLSIGTASTSEIPSTPNPLIASPRINITSKQQLAKEALGALGIAQKYDLYFDHAIGLIITTDNSKFIAWLQEMLAREAGWRHVEEAYIARLEADFSEEELQELLTLFQRSTIKKLLQSEIQAYLETSPTRYRLLNNVWNSYNEGRLNPPPDIFP